MTLPVPVPATESYPLTALQQGMLFHSLSQPGHGLYIQQLVCDLREDLDVGAWVRAWQQLVGRHAVLRTGFALAGGDTPRQFVQREVVLPWEATDWRERPAAEQERDFECWLRADRERDFAWQQAPLFRLALFRLGNAHYKLVWTSHHAILDGRSRLILLRELGALYDALRAGRVAQLPPPMPFQKFVDWVQTRDFEAAELFWRDLLSSCEAPTVLELGAVSAPDARGPAISRRSVRLSAALHGQLRSLAAAHDVTLNTLIQGAWAILLSRYSAQSRVLFGATRAGRGSLPGDVAGAVGLLMNTVPVAVEVGADVRLGPWLRQLRATWRAMRPHEHTPLLMIRRWSRLDPRAPLWQSLVNFETSELNDRLREAGPGWRDRRVEIQGWTSDPLVLSANSGNYLSLRIEYDTQQFAGDAIERMLSHLTSLLEGFVADPETKIGDLPLLTAAERQQLLVDWNATAVDYPGDKCVHELFEEQAARTPHAVAVVCGEQQLTYAELNTRANQLAHYLRRLGITPDMLLGICLDRSLELMVGLLGILKAGGAYLPLEPDWPAQRLQTMAADARVRLVLTQAAHQDRLRVMEARLICLDWEAKSLVREAGANPPLVNGAEHLAYVMFTSGSTGVPKGVEIPHRAIVRLLCGVDYARFDGSLRVAQLAPLAFDASTWEIWGPLLHGGCCVLVPGRVPDPADLERLIQRHRVNALWLTASLFNTILDQRPQALAGIDQLLTGGEALSVPHVRRALALLEPTTQLTNGYGPTESTTFASCFAIPRDLPAEAVSVPIGRPIANTRVYVLDPQGRPVPVGVPGELYVGGDGLARGYLNRPELTAERFVQLCFGQEAPVRLYRTGDRVRWRADGMLEFLGRFDDQVKMRGYRIELGEIEAVLRQHPAVTQCVVLLREDRPGDKRLVAYYVASTEQTARPAELTLHLRARLPEQMVPASLVELSQLPLSPNGKVDRRALPAPDEHRPELDTPYVAPRDAVERQLASIWAQVLGVARVGVNDDFFELGGHSLLAVTLLTRVRERLAGSVSLAAFLRQPTLAALAKLLTRLPQETRPDPLVALQTGGVEPPFFCVHPAGGFVLRYAALVRYLDPRQTFYGLEHPGILDPRDTTLSVQALASRHVRAIRNRQPTGPYLLGGWSLGGVIAYEMAQQLLAASERVAFLGLLDTTTSAPRDLGDPYGSTGQLARFLRIHGLSDMAMSRCVDEWRNGAGHAPLLRVYALATESGWLPRGLGFDLFRRLFELYVGACAAWRRYVPQFQYEGRITLFRRSDRSAAAERSGGWDQVRNADLEIHDVPGDHDTMLQEPHVAVLATKLQACLDAARSVTAGRAGAAPRCGVSPPQEMVEPDTIPGELQEDAQAHEPA